MNTDRIKEIQEETAYPESVSVQQALLKVWNETEQEQLRIAAVMGSTHLIVLKDWITPYNSVKKGNHAPAYYWAEKLGKTEDEFIKDFTDGCLDEWFKVDYP